MKSIHELRMMEVRRLAEFKTADPTESDIAEAKQFMNRFYRLYGLSERNLYLANDARTCNTRSTQASEALEEKRFRKLNADFKSTYGLELCYCGYAPSIGVIHRPSGAFSEKITRWFYQ